MAIVHGEDLKSKQSVTKLARFKKVLFESLKDHESAIPELRKEGEQVTGRGANAMRKKSENITCPDRNKFSLWNFRFPGKLLIAELMPNTSSNIEYFPRGSRVIAVEPEPIFEKIYNERKHEISFNHVKLDRFVNARPESLEGIADNSVDVVVATLVCCSVERLDFTMREIKRVLVRVS